ncbi:hypothetical protein A2702_03785 [Candidatus Amesbacteria bacterium RIFCSPHIGHO2_01_FULL_48_75]|nr:MAG: hypothetical protein A2702_03785 [Candidatus Amesbacteria bacterium RIFCSPHIGHO2_01_FULL_48_75]
MYKKFRFTLRFLVALMKKNRFALSFGLILAIVISWLLPKLLPLTNRFGHTRHIGLIGRYTITDLPKDILQRVSLGLTTLDASGSASPALATGWQATDSGKTYIFDIDTSLHWQNGEPVKSQDIKYNFRDAEIVYPDSGHLVIKLDDPFSPLPSVVSRPVLKSTGFLALLSRPRLVGVGSYQIGSYRKNGSLLTTLTLFPVKPRSNLPNLVYHFFPSAQIARTAFKMGLVDELNHLTDVGDLASWPNLTLDSNPLFDRFIGVFFNTDDPFLSGTSGKNFRLALSYAIDKNRWPHRAFGPIPPSSWAYNPDVKKYDFDLDRAKDLLSKVEKLPDKFTLTTVPIYAGLAEQLKSDWSGLGLQVSISISPEIPNQFQALLIAQAIPSDPDQYHLWHSTAEVTNLTRLKNPRIDKLLEDGRTTMEQNSRKIIYSDFQKFLVEESPAIFLYYPDTYTVSRTP